MSIHGTQTHQKKTHLQYTITKESHKPIHYVTVDADIRLKLIVMTLIVTKQYSLLYSLNSLCLPDMVILHMFECVKE